MLVCLQNTNDLVSLKRHVLQVLLEQSAGVLGSSSEYSESRSVGLIAM